MSFRLIRSEAWFTSDEIAGAPGLDSRKPEISPASTQWDMKLLLPLDDRLCKLETVVVSLLGGILVLVREARHQMVNQTMDCIRNSGAAIGGHDCILVV